MKDTNISLIISSSDYKQWLTDISIRFKQQQVKAAVHINSDKLEFYWSIGRDICEMNIEERWGEGVIKVLSRDIKRLLPELTGLTPGGLYYCKRFYLLYNQLFEKVPQVGEIISSSQTASKKTVASRIVSNAEGIINPLHCVVQDVSISLNIFAIPWGHHKVIIDRFEKEPAKALFYVVKTLENNWSRGTLLNMIGDKGQNNGLYERYGKVVNNFPSTIPYPMGDLAKELINDPLNLSFLKLKEKFDENMLKQALVRHVNELLMSLGVGFAYMGQEYLLSVGGKEQFSDLLFYNTRLHAYVVVEVKVTEFESSYLGQLSGYMSLVNHILKTEIDQPTIGLLICKSKNNIFAQYCLEGYSQPIAITAYDGIQILPKNFNESLPSIEELELEIKEKK